MDKQRKFSSYLLLVALGLLSTISSSGQILNADRFGKQVDTLDRINGEFNIGVDLNKRRELLFNVYSKAELSYLIRNEHLLIFAGSFNLFRSGSNDLVNGGFAHLRSRLFFRKRFHPEFFGQIQLDAIRGLETRGLVGGNLRIRLTESEKGGIFFAQGFMYEFERWNYDGVDDDVEVIDDTPVERSLIRMNTYLSMNRDLTSHLNVVLMIYFQARPDSFINQPRIAADAQVMFKITEALRFSISYNSYYETHPVVPIDNFYFSMKNKLSVVW